MEQPGEEFRAAREALSSGILQELSIPKPASLGIIILTYMSKMAHYHVRILARENEEERTLSRKKNLNVTHFCYS